MAIGTVKVNESNGIDIYDEDGRWMASMQDAADGLVGYTSTTITIKVGDHNEIYDENGNYKTSV